MPPFLLTSAARKDIIDIGRFTSEKWGKRQRNKYLKQLDDAFRQLPGSLILAAMRKT